MDMWHQWYLSVNDSPHSNYVLTYSILKLHASYIVQALSYFRTHPIITIIHGCYIYIYIYIYIHVTCTLHIPLISAIWWCIYIYPILKYDGMIFVISPSDLLSAQELTRACTSHGTGGTREPARPWIHGDSVAGSQYCFVSTAFPLPTRF